MLGVDVGRPIKSVLGPALEQIELGLDDAICERIGVDIDLMHSPAVKTIDNQLCATEAVILGMAGDSAAGGVRAAGGRRVRDPQAGPARRAGLLRRGAAHGGGAGLWRAAVSGESEGTGRPSESAPDLPCPGDVPGLAGGSTPRRRGEVRCAELAREADQVVGLHRRRRSGTCWR